nr:MAG TPA: hypothetical protein [Caudoviricetes sp.]
MFLTNDSHCFKINYRRRSRYHIGFCVFFS